VVSGKEDESVGGSMSGALTDEAKLDILDCLTQLEEDGDTYVKIILEAILECTGMLTIDEIKTTWKDCGY
jgi:hypothetical protein